MLATDKVRFPGEPVALIVAETQAEALAARVLREEHRIYPAALNAVARSLTAANVREGRLNPS